MEERLQKILARAGVASRRAAEALIVGRRVTVNGRVVNTLGAKADPASDDVRLDGERLRAERQVTVLLHKPDGVVTTLEDPEGRTTVRALLPPELGRIFPVGRLDYHTSGLLLLTNDGDLAARLLHPKMRIPRTYRAKVNGRPGVEALSRLRHGVRLPADPERGERAATTGPAQVDVEQERGGKAWLRITIREGKRREVRRMCGVVGHRVDRLVRVRFGPIELGELPPGAWRPLSQEELLALRVAAGLASPPQRRKRTARPRRPTSSARASSRVRRARG